MENFESDKFEVETFTPESFVTEDNIDFSYLRRGVIGINKVGYAV